MIKVNTKDSIWSQGMTVQDLLDEKQFVFKHIIVRVNGVYVPPEMHAAFQINDGDNVMVVHLMAGG